MSDVDLALKFFLQLAVILLVCRTVGWVGRFFGQTQVVSEMLAGVFLGPSLLGLFFPEVQAWLFPAKAVVDGVEIRHPSMQILYVASQLGLVLYMFLVGLELDVGMLRDRKRGAVLVASAGIVAPFLLGSAFSFVLYRHGSAFESHVSPWAGALYVGAAMAITAFPMLARIIYECGIARTTMGTLALTAAAANDALAWCLLAIVLAATKASAQIAFVAIGGGTAFVLGLIFLGRPALRFLEDWTRREGTISSPIMVTAMCVLLLGAFATDAIGIYAIFGAFVVGVAMPRGMFSEIMQDRLESVTVGLLLPLFFVYSGLNTSVGLLNSWALWGLAGLTIVVAMLGKGVACTLAARAAGESWRDATMIGTLMNARGLIELIILNIGYQAGVITQTLFTMMVLMAIVTTLIASPLFNALYRGSRLKLESPGAEPAAGAS